VLIYPNTDLTLSRPSAKEKASGWGISTDIIAWGAEFWVPDAARRVDPAVSPLFEPDLGGLPAALIVTAEHDPCVTRARRTRLGWKRRARRSSCAASQR
jgi:acetyl esterase